MGSAWWEWGWGRGRGGGGGGGVVAAERQPTLVESQKKVFPSVIAPAVSV